MLNLLRATVLVASVTLLSPTAHAVTFTVTNDITSTFAPTFADFDSPTITSVGSFTGDWYLNGGVAPGGSGNWTTLGTQSQPAQSGTLTFVTPVSYVGFRWGSTDRYNKLEVYDNEDTLVKTVTGIPDVTDPQVFNGVFFNLFGGGSQIKKLVFTSDWAFEADNFAASPVPVPAALPLLASALVAAGIAGRRGQRKPTSIA